ncbi:MAG: DUF4143 domain-containing protein [Chitinivibrionales bacterium]|nr:DUF4143 domain-containing protein [Chitinivibrionales bacterium]
MNRLPGSLRRRRPAPKLLLAALGHPKVGAPWEGFVVEQLCSMYGGHDFFFRATHSGAELDLLLTYKGRRYGFEMKLTDSPRTTKSMHIGWIICASNTSLLYIPASRPFRFVIRSRPLPPKIFVSGRK